MMKILAALVCLFWWHKASALVINDRWYQEACLESNCIVWEIDLYRNNPTVYTFGEPDTILANELGIDIKRIDLSFYQSLKASGLTKSETTLEQVQRVIQMANNDQLAEIESDIWYEIGECTVSSFVCGTSLTFGAIAIIPACGQAIYGCYGNIREIGKLRKTYDELAKKMRQELEQKRNESSSQDSGSVTDPGIDSTSEGAVGTGGFNPSDFYSPVDYCRIRGCVVDIKEAPPG